MHKKNKKSKKKQKLDILLKQETENSSNQSAETNNSLVVPDSPNSIQSAAFAFVMASFLTLTLYVLQSIKPFINSWLEKNLPSLLDEFGSYLEEDPENAWYLLHLACLIGIGIGLCIVVKEQCSKPKEQVKKTSEQKKITRQKNCTNDYIAG